MVYIVEWGCVAEPEQVDSTSDLDLLLDMLEHQRGDDGAPFIVSVYPDDDDTLVGVQLGVGHPDR